MGLLRSPATLKCKLIYITLVIDEWQIKKVEKLKLTDIGKLFQRRATLGKKDDLNNSVLA